MSEKRRSGSPGNRWTAEDIPRLDERIVLVTGANTGLGYATALALARKGARVIMGVRSTERGKRAAALILEQVPQAAIDVRLLELSDLTQVKRFAQAVRRAYAHLDVLINNAGVMAFPSRLESKQGFELQFAINHLGHFALTGHLLPLLGATQAARVVTISSLAHYRGAIHFNDLQLVKRYTPWKAYSQSKLANLLFALELHRRLVAAESNVISAAAHPGLTATNISRNTTCKILHMLIQLLFTQHASAGALPQLRAAVDPAVRGGEYYGPTPLLETRGYPGLAHIRPHAQDQASAQRLWQLSEQLTGVAYDL